MTDRTTYDDWLKMVKDYKKTFNSLIKSKKEFQFEKGVYLTCESVIEQESGCDQCKIRYPSIQVIGKIRSDEPEDTNIYSYFADIGPYYLDICNCTKDDEDDEDNKDEVLKPTPLFKATLGEDCNKMYHIFMDDFVIL